MNLQDKTMGYINVVFPIVRKTLKKEAWECFNSNYEICESLLLWLQVNITKSLTISSVTWSIWRYYFFEYLNFDYYIVQKKSRDSYNHRT